MYKGRRSVGEVLRNIGIISIPALLVALVAVGLWLGDKYLNSYYLSETTIQGNDCSKLTVEDAKVQIEEAEVKLQFIGGTDHLASGKP